MPDESDATAGHSPINAQSTGKPPLVPVEPAAGREDFWRFFELAAIGLAQADAATGRWLRVNPKMCEITGYAAAELLRLRVFDISHPDDRQRDEAAFQSVAGGKIPSYNLEKRYVRKDGGSVWVNVNAALLRDADGRPAWVMATVEDISQRKAAEAEILRQKNLLNTIVRNSSEAIYAKDVRGKYLVINEAGARMIGQPADAIIGHTDAELLDAELAGKFRESDELVMASGQSREQDEVVFMDGKPRAFLSHKSLWRDAEGRVIGVIGVSNDITGRKQAEQELRRLSQWLLRTQSISRVGGWAFNMKTGEVWASPAARRIYGVPDQGSLSLPRIQSAVRAEFRPRLDAALRDLMEQGIPYDLEFQIVRANDQAIIDIHSIAEYNADEATVVGVIEDITPRKLAHSALREREEQLRLFVEHSPAAIAMFDRAMTYLVVSRRWLEDYRLDGQKVVGRSHYEIFPETPQRWREVHQRCLAGMIESCEEDRFPRVDGTVDWVRWEVRPWNREDGDIGGIIIFSENITARKRADEALQKIEARQAKMVANLGDVIVIIDRQGINQYKSPNLEKRFGWRVADLVGTPALMNVHPKDQEAAQRFMLSLFSQPNATGTLECRYRCKDGSYKWIEFTGVNLLDDPDVQGLLGNYHDISQRKAAEAKLHKNEELFMLFMRHSPIYLYVKKVTPDESRFVLASDNHKELIGIAGRELAGKSMGELFPAEFARAMTADDQAVVASGKVLKREEEFNGRNLTTIKFPVVQGEETLLAGFTWDITERVQAEAASQRGQKFAQALLDSLPGIFYLYTYPECRLALWNKRHETLLSYSADELKDFHVTAWHKPEARPAVMAAIEMVMQQGNASIEAPLWSKDGRPIPFVLTGVPFESQGKTYFMGIGLDITERKLAEEAHARLATVVEQASEIIMITDTKGRFTYANPSFEKITGYSQAEVLGKSPAILKSGRQDEEFYRKLWQTILNGEVWRGHFVNRRKDGTFFEEDATISPVRDATGKIVNFVAVKRDVTHEMELENQLRQSQRLDAIGQLAGGVAHDFNNILSSIMMQTELIAMSEALTSEDQDGLKQIRADANRAANLTRQLLLFSRRQVMQLQNLDLNDVVANLAKMLQRIIGEDVQMELRLHPRPLMTHADPGMLDQVLMNLVVNARDAMPKGGCLSIAVSERRVDDSISRQESDAAPGHYACLSVGDTGEGIAPEVLPRIFEPFFTTKGVGKGTGLGLATVFGIVKQHKGWIKVDNHPGHGVTFHVYFPACSSATSEPDQVAEPPTPSLQGTETILLVEDELSVRAPMSLILRRHGYQVLEAANGVEALQLWPQCREQVALLLTDLVMPGGMGGHELARILEAEAPNLKVIYTSGYSAEIAGQDLHLLPGENYIQKPFSPVKLLNTVRQCLDSEHPSTGGV